MTQVTIPVELLERLVGALEERRPPADHPPAWNPKFHAALAEGRSAIQSAPAQAEQKHPDEFRCPICFDDPANVQPVNQALVEALKKHGTPPGDWACKECRPNSDMLKPGFQCLYHAAISQATAQTPVVNHSVDVNKKVEGWQLVPVEPTQDMLIAGVPERSPYGLNYACLLYTSPSPRD